MIALLLFLVKGRCKAQRVLVEIVDLTVFADKRQAEYPVNWSAARRSDMKLQFTVPTREASTDKLIAWHSVGLSADVNL